MERSDIEYKLYGIKSRFDERQRSRADADDKEKGEWITTPTGVHIHLNEEGVADKGPKGAVDAINKNGEDGNGSGAKGNDASKSKVSPKGSVSKNYKLSPIDTMTDKDFDGDIEMKKFASAVIGEMYPDDKAEDYSVSVRKGYGRNATVCVRYKGGFPETFSIEEYSANGKSGGSKCLVCVRNGTRVKDPVLAGKLARGKIRESFASYPDFDKQESFKP